MKYILLILTALIFTSCSTKDENITSNKDANKQNKTTNKFQKPVPNWIMNPNIGVKYGAVGIAQKQANTNLQYLSAVANGKRKLSEQFRLELQKQTPASFDTNSKMIGSTFNIVALESSENITKNATIKAAYVDAQGTLYIWMVIQ